MSTFTIDPISDITNAEFRGTWRETLRAGITMWRNAGEPRDAITVETINLITDTLSRMRAVCWGSELARIEELTADMERVTTALSNASATAPADLPAPDAPPEVHADCLARQATLEERLREARADITDAHDHRLATMWERIHAVADERGYCSTYDELAEEADLPARQIEVTVTVTGTYTATVNAGRLAEDWRSEVEDFMDCCSVDWSIDSYTKD